MIIDEQYAKILDQITKLTASAKEATTGKNLKTPSEEALNQLHKATNELQTVIQATISRFRKTGVFRYGVSEEFTE